MPEDQDLSTVETPIKKIEFGFGGIFLGLAFVVVAMLALNYFRIISLPSLYSKLSILPQKELSVEEKAAKVGYKIAWKGQTEDGSGRAVLASEERNINGWVDKFGWQKTDLGDGRMVEYRGQGLFERWEEVPNSKDLYIVLNSPLTNEEVKGRILIDNSKLNSIKDNNIINSNKTRFLTENLGFLNNDNNALKRVGLFADFNKEKINGIFKKGDVIVLNVLYLPKDKTKDDKVFFLINPKDENNIFILISVVARFF